MNINKSIPFIWFFSVVRNILYKNGKIRRDYVINFLAIGQKLFFDIFCSFLLNKKVFYFSTKVRFQIFDSKILSSVKNKNLYKFLIF